MQPPWRVPVLGTPAGPLPFPTCRRGCRMRPCSHVGGRERPSKGKGAGRQARWKQLRAGKPGTRECGGWEGPARRRQASRGKEGVGRRTLACPAERAEKPKLLVRAGEGCRFPGTRKPGSVFRFYHFITVALGKTLHTSESRASSFFEHRPDWQDQLQFGAQ